MSPVAPRAFADPDLVSAGTRAVEGLFGSLDAYLALERRRQPMLRRGCASPVPWTAADVWTLLGQDRLSVDDHEVRLVRTGPEGLESLPAGRYARAVSGPAGGSFRTPRVDAVRTLYAEGATIVLQQLDRITPAFAAFGSGLSAALGHPCQVTSYLSPPGAQGLDVHHDTHDVLVLQLEGEKAFEVFDPVIDQPVPRIELSREQARRIQPTSEHVMRPGDLLYLPRGVPHRARSQAGHSLHLTVGILAVTWACLVEDLARELYFAPPLRRACAAGELFDAETLGRSAAQAAEALVAWLQAFGAERLAALACRRYVAAFGARPVGPSEAAPEIPACALEPDGDGGSVLITPAGARRLSADETAEWLAVQAGAPAHREVEETWA